jgi:hypothetical protein
MLWELYLRKGSVYVPTVAQIEPGYYLVIEPVEVVSAQDLEAVQRAIIGTISRGNPRVPAPNRAEALRPVLLKYSGVKSWSAFERNAENWSLVEKNGRYQLKPARKRADRGWEDDPDKIEEFPTDIGIEELAYKVARSIRMVFDSQSNRGGSGTDREKIINMEAPSRIVTDALALAEQVSRALSQSGYRADFSLESLKEVDRFFDEQVSNGKPKARGFLSEELGARLFAIGAYVGEVIRRHYGGDWQGDDNDPEAEINIALVFEDGTRLWPVQRVMKRFKNGTEDGISVYGAFGLGSP